MKFFFFAAITFSILFNGGPVRAQQAYAAATAPATINTYSRQGSTITVTKTPSLQDIAVCSQPGVTCKNFTPGTATLTASCAGANNVAAWSTVSTTGSCWSHLDICQTVGGQQVCNAATVTPAQSAVFAPFTQCTVPQYPKKNYCVFSYTGNAGITGNTTDDMFRLSNGGGAFFEYLNMGTALDSQYRLEWISRAGGIVTRDIMVPSGPAGTFKDYKDFISHKPAFVTAEPACYPVKIDLCNLATLQLPPINGLCSTASGLCLTGTASPVTDDGTSKTWNCTGANGGTSQSCKIADTLPGVCGPSGTCSAGTLANYNDDGTNKTWSCVGTNGVSTPCALADGVNAQCGPAAGICSPGTLKGSVIDDGTTKTWVCAGANGGKDSPTCSLLDPVNGACGPSSGMTLDSAPVSGLCATTGGNTPVTGTGPWTWTCNGTNGGASSPPCVTAATHNSLCGGQGACGCVNGGDVIEPPGYTVHGSCNAHSACYYTWSCRSADGSRTQGCTASAAVNQVPCR